MTMNWKRLLVVGLSAALLTADWGETAVFAAEMEDSAMEVFGDGEEETLFWETQQEAENTEEITHNEDISAGEVFFSDGAASAEQESFFDDGISPEESTEELAGDPENVRPYIEINGVRYESQSRFYFQTGDTAELTVYMGTGSEQYEGVTGTMNQEELVFQEVDSGRKSCTFTPVIGTLRLTFTKSGSSNMTISIYPVNGNVKEEETRWQSGDQWVYGTLRNAVLNVAEGGTIYLQKDVTLTQALECNGRSAILTSAPEDGTVYRIIRGDSLKGMEMLRVYGSSLTLKDIVIDGNNVESTYPAIRAGGSEGGTVILEDGAVIKNNINNNSNHSYAGGGAFWILEDSSVIVNGGEITGNKAYYGGGAYISGGSMTLKRGRITGNTAFNEGGGVYQRLSSVSVFNMTGGSIEKNTAQYGGGVYLCRMGDRNTAKMVLSGGQITENEANVKGGGVMSGYYGTIEISGNPVVKDNIGQSGTDNIYLDNYSESGNSHKEIKIVGGLGENASVGIRRPGAVEGVDEVAGSYPDYDTPYPWSDIYTITSSDYGKFFSDDPEFCLLHDTENNQIIIKKIVQCSVENKDYPAMFLYNGTAIQAPSEANFTTDSKGEMSFSWYKDSVSAENRLEGAPVYAGNYILRVDVAAYENMSVGYTEVSVYIEKAPVAPNAPDGSREVEFEITRVSETELPKGWIWLDSDADKTLEVNKAVTATAVYNGTDKGNYETESVEILITRKPCTHTGGTELKNVRKATYTSTGYTGDTYCKTCGERIRTGKSIAMLSYTAADIAANSNTLNVNAKLGWSGAKVKITWSSVSDAEGYDVYAAKCGKDLKLVKTVKKGTTQALLTKAGGAKVKTSSGYKVRVRAYRIINGKKKYIANSLVLHTMGKSNKKNTNATKVKASRSAYALTKGKTAATSVKVTKQNRKKSLPGTAHAPRLRYWSTNTKVATVGSAGKIRAVGKGSCYVYVAAQNGVKTRVKVTVK